MHTLEQKYTNSYYIAHIYSHTHSHTNSHTHISFWPLAALRIFVRIPSIFAGIRFFLRFADFWPYRDRLTWPESRLRWQNKSYEKKWQSDLCIDWKYHQSSNCNSGLPSMVRSMMMQNTAFQCTVLYCAMLYYTKLYNTILYYTILFCTVLLWLYL